MRTLISHRVKPVQAMHNADRFTVDLHRIRAPGRYVVSHFFFGGEDLEPAVFLLRRHLFLVNKPVKNNGIDKIATKRIRHELYGRNFLGDEYIRFFANSDAA